MLFKKGFTLIELLIVIIIIGILATLAIPQYTNLVEKARAAEALNMIGALRTGEAAYKLESTDGQYTTDLTQLFIANLPLSNGDAVSRGQYWFYEGTNADATAYAIKVFRSSKAGGDTSKYIQLYWSDTAGASWSGTHPGTPK